MPAIAVVGAGIIGSSVAYRLAAAGARVVLLDQGAPGGGTTSTSFAWLNANNKPPPAYHDLNVAGIRAHTRLRDDLGRAPWLHLTGTVMAATGVEAAALVAHLEAMHGAGYPAERIDRRRAQALEPAVRWPADGESAFAHFPGEGWVDGPGLVRQLVAAAQARGADIRPMAAVTAIDGAGGRVTGVRLASGDQINADTVVITAGRWSDRLLSLAGFRLSLAPTCGVLAVTTPLRQQPRGVVFAPGVHFRPEGDGRVVLQAGDTDALVGPETPPDPALPACAELWRRAGVYLPELRGGRIAEARVGIRALPSDGFPVVGFVPGAAGLYLAVTHSGITLGPLLGEIAAAEVAGGAPDAQLAPFRPARCVTAR